MWDYDKLFANNNVVGIKVLSSNNIYNYVVDSREPENNIWSYYKNSNLKDKDNSDFEIQYIIRLDEHGNVVEKLFDREVDMKLEPEPMPKLETGMFVRVKNYNETKLGIIYTEANHIIYQDGGYDFVYEDEIMGKGIYSQIVEIYNQDACAFDYCEDDVLIWRDPDYQAYLNSKVQQ